MLILRVPENLRSRSGAGLILAARNFLRIVLCDEPKRESGQVWQLCR